MRSVSAGVGGWMARWAWMVVVGAVVGCGPREQPEPEGAPQPGVLPANSSDEPVPAPLPPEALSARACPEFDDNGVLRCTGFLAPTERSRLVIRDRQTWSTFWKNAFSHSAEAPPLPEIDFANEQLLIATSGTKPSSGYFLYFGAMPTPMTQEVVELTPGSDCMTLAVLTHPWAAKRVARTDAELTFTDRTDAYRCGP